MVETYDSLGEFRDKFFRQLTQTIIRTYPITTASATLTATTPLPQPPATPAMCDEAKELLEASASDPSGRLMRIRHLGGLIVQASGRNFSKEGDARSEARWEGVIRELEGLGFIEDRGYKREVFAVTDEGFRIADLLRSSQP